MEEKTMKKILDIGRAWGRIEERIDRLEEGYKKINEEIKNRKPSLGIIKLPCQECQECKGMWFGHHSKECIWCESKKIKTKKC